MRKRNILTKFVILLTIGATLFYAMTRIELIDLPSQYDALALPDLAQRPNFITPFQLKLIDADVANCQLALQRAGIAAQLTPAQADTGYCSKKDTLNLRQLSKSKLRPEITRCAIAARLYLWERHLVQPAAMWYFNEPIAEILHFGSYSCRTIRGSNQVSQHATANAFDISGFKLKSGKTISLKRDWMGSAASRSFLRETRDGACDYFNLTLSPDYNKDHADHFHVDMGWWRGCN